MQMQIANEPQHMQSSNLIESMCINTKENMMYVLTNFGQMIAGQFNFKDQGKLPYAVPFDYVQGRFHNNVHEITGLDICIRKQLVVTCSKDKTVCIWDYNQRRLEFQHQFAEECMAVAFHPSGLHLVVAMQDKIEIYNVLSDKLTKSKTINQKGCGEIKFSHGGHLFATIKDQTQIWVYNFYTQECSEKMKFHGHVQKVKCISWFENDLGFSTCCLNGNIYFYALYQYDKNIKPGQRIDNDCNKKDVKFTSVANVPGRQYEVLAAGSDHMITSNIDKKGKFNPSVAVQQLISQLVITPSGKSVIAGVGEVGRPGAVQVWLRSEDKPLEKSNEVQAHSKPVEKLRLSDDCMNLFSVGLDGMLCIFEVRDRDPRAQKKQTQALQFSQEILTDQSAMEKDTHELEGLQQEDAQLREPDNNNVEKGIEMKRQTDKISSLQGRLESDKIDAESKYLSLQENKREAMNNNENKRKDLLDRQQEEIETKRNEYSQKMLEDSGRFNQLQVQKEEERLMYQNSLDKTKREHLEKIQAEQEAHRKEIEVKNT